MPLDPAVAAQTIVTPRKTVTTIGHLLKRLTLRRPTRAQVEAVGALHTSPSAAMVMIDARWLALLDDLVDAPAHQKLAVLSHVLLERSADARPTPTLCERIIAEAGAEARPWAREVCDRLMSESGCSRLEPVASGAAAALLAGRCSPWTPDELLGLATYCSCPAGNVALVTAASPAARLAWLRKRLRIDERRTLLSSTNEAEVRQCHFGDFCNGVESVLPALHLCVDPACRAEISAVVALLGESKQGQALAKLVTSAQAGTPTRVPPDTQVIADAVAYAVRAFAARRPRPAPRKAKSAATGRRRRPGRPGR